MSNDMSASATTKIPVSEITTFHAPHAAPSTVDAKGAAEAAAAPVQELVIQPSTGWIGINWPELWRYRELLYFLVWRDVKVRYKQAALGIAWAVLEPVMTMILFTAIFGVAAGLRNNLPATIPYAVFIFAGLIPWKLFQTALTQGGMSLVNSQNLLTKIYFPRLFVPSSTIGSALVDMTLQFGVFAVILLWYQYIPSWQIVFLPLLVVLTATLAAGMAYLLSALTITYRDFRFLIPVISQMWMYLSLIHMPAPQSIRDSVKWQIVLGANPMYGIVSAFRACVTGDPEAVGFKPAYIVSSCVTALAALALGMFYFRKTEKRFADIA
jgi:lipopolysaccharide transport system permease protein